MQKNIIVKIKIIMQYLIYLFIGAILATIITSWLQKTILQDNESVTHFVRAYMVFLLPRVIESIIQKKKTFSWRYLVYLFFCTCGGIVIVLALNKTFLSSYGLVMSIIEFTSAFVVFEVADFIAKKKCSTKKER